MSVYKREFKNGVKWCVYLVLPNGKKFRKAVGTKKEAEKVEQKLKSQLVTGKWDLHETSDIVFESLANQYLDYARINKAKNTFIGDKCRIRLHLVPYFGSMTLTQITPQILESYKVYRLEEGASPITVNHDLINLSHMLRLAIRWGYIDRNVMSSVSKLKVPEKSKIFLNQPQIGGLLNIDGMPGRIRTAGLQIRSLTLYPTELQAHKHYRYKQYHILR